jgi:hypothetical protein
MRNLFSRKSLIGTALGVLIAAFGASPAAAAVDTSQCAAQEFSQAFAFANDSNYYTTLPGDASDEFSGEGWQLSGGASITTETLADGSEGQVLDLPSGSKAVSPVICVTSDYPVARGYVRNVKGSEGVFFYVAYEGTSTWEHPKNTGQIHGKGTAFTLVTPVNMQPFKTAGLQPMRITLVPGGKTSDFEVYDLDIDPHGG